MYSGIITKTARVISNKGSENGRKLLVETDICSLVKEGDSVGINGVCLTVTSFDAKTVSFDVWPESLKRTTLEKLQVDDLVHLELPLKHGEFNGGHNVTGHVDYVAALLERTNVDNSDQVKFWFSLPMALDDLLPLRGSAAVDGVSLTITDRKAGAFSVSLIPETLNRTHLGQLQQGENVNIEVDFNARHIQDSSGILSLTVPEENRSPKETDQLSWALKTLKKGGAVIVTDENGADTECSIVAATEALTPAVLTFAMGMARTGCSLAVSGNIAERLAIPAPVINHEIDEEGRRYLVPISHLEGREHDFSAEALLKTISLFSNPDNGIGDWKCPGNVSSIQVLSEEVSARRGVLEGAVKLVGKAEFEEAALCLVLLAANGKPFNREQAQAFAARFDLPCVTLAEALS